MMKFMIMSKNSISIFRKEDDSKLLFIHIFKQLFKDILFSLKRNFVSESLVQCVYNQKDTKGPLYHHALLPAVNKLIVLDDAIYRWFYVEEKKIKNILVLG